MSEKRTKISVEKLHFSYGKHVILDGVSADFETNSISAIVGPSGQGKSTFLLTLNRLWEDIPGVSFQGSVNIDFDGKMTDIYNGSISKVSLRRLVGLVFQKPNPLPMSIIKNVGFPLKLAGEKDKDKIAGASREVLEKTYLWDEVKNRLDKNALDLSGGQQQRLCIARAMILKPEVLLLDEPTSSLDSKAVEVIEQLMVSLKKQCTLIVVSHYLDQVKRIADSVYELSERKLKLLPDARKNS